MQRRKHIFFTVRSAGKVLRSAAAPFFKRTTGGAVRVSWAFEEIPCLAAQAGTVGQLFLQLEELRLGRQLLGYPVGTAGGSTLSILTGVLNR